MNRTLDTIKKFLHTLGYEINMKRYRILIPFLSREVIMKHYHFSAHLDLRYYYHFVSVCFSIYFHLSISNKPLNKLEVNLAELLLGWTSTFIMFSFHLDIKDGC